VIRRSLIVVFVWTIFSLPVAYGENPNNSISVTATDFQFMPNTWTIASGQAIALSFTNNGVQEHEWVLLKQGTEVTLPFNDDDEEKVFWEMEAGPGVIKEGIFSSPPQAGTYTIVCGKPRHIERGMTAMLIVQ